MGARALPLVVRPILGETALSVLSRLADVNGVSLPVVSLDVGNRRRPDGWDEEHWTKLAQRLALPVDRLEHLRTRPANIATAPAAVTVMGQPVHFRCLVTDRLRLCPECVAERRMLKEVWRLTHNVACMSHARMLIDTCECGRPFDILCRAHPNGRGLRDDLPNGWAHDPFRCTCGKPFAENQAPPATHETLECAHMMIRAFGEAALPERQNLWLVKGGYIDPPFSTMHIYDLMAVIDVVGRAATTPDDEDERTGAKRYFAKSAVERGSTLDDAISHVEAAMAVMHDWPNAYHALLSDVAGRNADAGDVLPGDLFATRIGNSLVRPRRGLDGMPIQALQTEMDAFLVARGYALRRKTPARISATARAVAVSMPRAKVARELGLSTTNHRLKRVYQEVASEMDDDPKVIGLTPAQTAATVLKRVQARLGATDDVLSPTDTSRYLNNTTSAGFSDHWKHPLLLATVDPDPVLRPHLKGKAFLKKDVEDMRRRIAEVAPVIAAHAMPDGFRPFRDASKVATQIAYTSTDLTLDIMSGAIPAVRIVEEPRLTDLFLDVDTARLRALEAQLAAMIGRDQFAAMGTCQIYLDRLWPDGTERLGWKAARQLRLAGTVRSQPKVNRTEGRERPLHWYSMVDMLHLWISRHGPSTSIRTDEKVRAAFAERSGVDK